MNWTEIISGLFNLVMIPLLIAASGYLISYIKLKKQELLNKTENETYKKYIEMLDKTITDCVTATTQTYVDSLKKQNKFDADAKVSITGLEYNKAAEILSDITEGIMNNKIYLNLKVKGI